MSDMYSRTELILGSEKMNKLKAASVLVVGLGGVGGYIAEALARAGVGRLGLCDMDRVDVSNINRQILALNSTVGRLKTDVSAERIRDINPELKLELFPLKVDSESLGSLNIGSWDYIADAIDDVPAKLMLIESCVKQNIPVISSMGTGNKLDPSKFHIAPIEQTHTCPLAKSMRKKLKDMGIKGVNVLFSEENPAAEGPFESIPSISYMPASAGLMIAGKIIRDIAEIH